MNGYLFFDPVHGYTREASSQLAKQGACEDLDAKTLELTKFGTQFQFKNTTQCHTLVRNFHCLSWVATTFERVLTDGTPVSCTSSSSDGEEPLPPCRSLCVEVADKCVYSHFYRMYLENVCGNIACVTEEEEKATANSSSPVVQTPCVAGAWETAVNNTFSRCSIREYEPETSVAASIAVSAALVAHLVAVLGSAFNT